MRLQPPSPARRESDSDRRSLQARREFEFAQPISFNVRSQRECQWLSASRSDPILRQLRRSQIDGDPSPAEFEQRVRHGRGRDRGFLTSVSGKPTRLMRAAPPRQMHFNGDQRSKHAGQCTGVDASQRSPADDPLTVSHSAEVSRNGETRASNPLGRGPPTVDRTNDWRILGGSAHANAA